MTSNLFAHRDFKRLFCIVALIGCVLVLLGQVLVMATVTQYKRQMIVHDYAIAGYLCENFSEQGQISIKNSDIPKLFISGKSDKNIDVGNKIMKSTGYNDIAQLRYFPEINTVYHRYAISFLVISLVIIVAVLSVIYLYFYVQSKKIECARDMIQSFLDGEIEVRLDDDSEETLSKLFHSINSMATSLNANITSEKQTKEFLKDTISDISHQLKTPLAALEMYNEIIKDDSADKTVVEKFADKTDTALTRMETLIQKFLHITRLDVGAIIFEMKQENIKMILQSIVNDFETRTSLEEKSIILDGSDSSVLFCDLDWIKEAVSNIVKNALDHTTVNDIITICWQNTPVVTKITIEDTGSGIHPEDIHYIFKRFYRSKFSQDRQGVGLGLPLAKAIIEAHNGTIMVESTLRKESNFKINFLHLTKL
ncbi:HAMP domain-containing histidine kinase [Clostridium estertheticum]|uniref:sensor histidine kinase n=1 Tax=Clostridium estertheticum TaxID=238834 RepID=UPI001C6E9648|nr:HAMP domain-containing sensor histidine kinase [Clostridium estertheticum]MBW9172760.1 HAMP domain-containing histidine kinase [Clostridium estertheticum]WLC77707.1 HAMP domain-containing histidine kinase [Clostridium estertheticum]